MTVLENYLSLQALWNKCLGFLVVGLICSSFFGISSAVAQEISEQTDTKPATSESTILPEESLPTSTEDSTDESVESDSESSGLSNLAILAVLLALFFVPVFLGGVFSKQFRMPEHSWKFSLAIGTIAAAVVIYSFGELKFGPDLSGGSTLIFELDKSAVDIEGKSDSEISDLVERTITALSNRVDPSGTKEVTIRKYGLDQIEIIIPRVDKQELEYIERNIYTAGILEFRITASRAFSDHRDIIAQAEKLAPNRNTLLVEGEKIAQWMPYNEDEFGPVGEERGYVKRLAGKQPQILVLYNDGENVTGDHLASSKASFDQAGRPSVAFTFKARGSRLFGNLTGKHKPNASGQEYHLGIVLDNKLLSAPGIREKITGQGEITGGMGQDGVDFIVDILQAGSLPAQLSKEPISRETISPTLGAETVEKGKMAIIYSLVAVMIFMLFYYRFAGVVACMALAANLVLIVGLMMLFKAAFTLPGLAGLVLTIGMSVDANVLIFERIREERKRGAALRMAIRNGFGRATQTIVDANVTTLITAIVIYKIAPDNVKGFGVTLIIGIVMSMYSAIFLSRIVFDVAERTRGLKDLTMAQIVRQTDIHFLSKRGLAAIFSLIVIGVGLFAVADRGADLLNIDFTGGSSVTIVLKEDKKMNFNEVKELLDAREELSDKNLSLVEVGESNTQYTVSCVEQDVTKLQGILTEVFGDSLQTYEVEANKIAPISSQSNFLSDSNYILASVANLDVEEEEEEEEASDGEAESSPENETNTDFSEEKIESAEESVSSSASFGDLFSGGTSAHLNFGSGGATGEVLIGYEAVQQLVKDALAETGHEDVAIEISNPEYEFGSARRFSDWEVKLALPEAVASEVFQQLEADTGNQPVFPLANKIGGRVASDMKTKAIAAILISLLGIVAYIWFRFQRVEYGLAAVVALVHDVLVTLGMIALSAYVVSSIPGLATGLMIEKFQISLPIVAAFLTIIGYSLNDTIVVFDRIREVKGKSPKLTEDIINTSINQTLGRTLLTSLTTLLSVILLYVLGGDGIHGFAFALVIGVIVGTYSSIFIASPVLLWMSNRSQAATSKKDARAA